VAERTEKAAQRSADGTAYGPTNGIADGAPDSVAVIATLGASGFAAKTLCRQIFRATLTAGLARRRFWPFLIVRQRRERSGENGKCSSNKHKARR
jgi:hypothetical protein